MHTLEISIFFIYFAILFGFAFVTYKQQKNNHDFILGSRSLNFWLTALSAHASDMSNWLFLAYPAAIFSRGIFEAWTAIGLTFCMLLNWQFVAAKIRKATEELKSHTLSTYFENRFQDTSGLLRIATAIFSVFFFMIYISSGLIGLGLLLESLLGIPYIFGIIAGLFIVVGSVFIGGYNTIAWIDLFQGLFLLAIIVFIPVLLLQKIGGIDFLFDAMQSKGISSTLFPDNSVSSWLQILFVSAGWGLGYFGQPHILTKFMGIKHVSEISKSKLVGLSWQAIVLTAATLIGMICIYVFPHQTADTQTITLELVKKTLFPSIAGLTLCAIVAATINVMAAQLLVAASNLSEDLYQRFYPATRSEKLLVISRISVVTVSLIALLIAWINPASLYQLVHYAWTGLGASFGPLVLASLYSRRVNKHGAITGLLVGGLLAALWHPLGGSLQVPAMIPAFACSFVSIFAVSWIARQVPQVQQS